MTKLIEQSNYLPELAARIRAEHEAMSQSLRRGVEHGMAAGKLLVEAKALVKHGQWLPWLKQHCGMSDRTARLYMQLAKNRETIEKRNRQPIADLTMNEAAALLSLSIGTEKLLEFAQKIERLGGGTEAVLALAAEEGFEVIKDPHYNPLHGRSEIEQRDWKLYAVCISDWTCKNIEWLLRNGWETVDQWLGREGDAFRKQFGMRSQPNQKANWERYLAERSHMSLADADAEVKRMQENMPDMAL